MENQIVIYQIGTELYKKATCVKIAQVQNRKE